MATPEDLAEELNGSWRMRLLITPTHTPKASIANALIALRDAPEWQGVLAYDEFHRATVAASPPPWQGGANQWQSHNWTDHDKRLATDWLHQQKIGVSIRDTSRAVEAVAQAHKFHPVKDYLNGLQWDGANRIEAFAATYLGAADTGYSVSVGRCLFLAAVARIMQPGCKADLIPIFEGPQGTFKSSMLNVLFTPWFSDDLAELGTKDAQMQMAGVWCLELAELSSMRRADIERVKAFASRREDRFRPSYGRYVITAPRQCVVVGTTNNENYLKDDTGARRFLPITCGRIDYDGVKRDRDQLWAEAVTLYRDGTTWWLVGRDEVAAAEAEQDERYAEDTWTDLIAKYTEEKDEVSIGDILKDAVGKPTEHWTQIDQKRVAACLRVQGCWKQVRKRAGWQRPRVYRRMSL